MKKAYIIHYLKQHKTEFTKKYGVTKLGLFGSYVRDEATKKSDIDILIELDERLTNIHENKILFQKQFESHFNIKVNIAREKYLKSFAKDEILNEVEYV